MSKSGKIFRLVMNMDRETKTFLGAVLVISVLPSVLNTYHIWNLSKFMLFGIFAMSLGLIWGYAGILSFGHAAYFGLGAYVMTICLTKFPAVNSVLSLVVTFLVPGLLGFLLSFSLLNAKVSGIYFVIITMVVALVIEQVAIAWYSLTRGLTGFGPIPSLRLGLGIRLDGDSLKHLLPYYYLILGLAVGIYFILFFLTHSKYGFVLKAIKNNQLRVSFLGYNVATVKTIAFTLACAIAGLSGGLYAPLVDFISPQLLGVMFSVQVIVWVAVGGRNTLAGPFLGALFISYMETFLSGLIVEAWLLVMGLLLIGVVLFWPEGVMSLILKPRRITTHG